MSFVLWDVCELVWTAVDSPSFPQTPVCRHSGSPRSSQDLSSKPRPTSTSFPIITLRTFPHQKAFTLQSHKTCNGVETCSLLKWLSGCQVFFSEELCSSDQQETPGTISPTLAGVPGAENKALKNVSSLHVRTS